MTLDFFGHVRNTSLRNLLCLITILKKCVKTDKKLNNFSNREFFLIILKIPILFMAEIQKCECPPGSETVENEDGMLICISCGGWVAPFP